MSLPPFLALCGAPKSGKSAVQDFLQQDYGVIPIDDGLPLRAAAMHLYGLSWRQVSTQQGKLEMVEINHQRFQVRQLLGDLGVYHEQKFGMNFCPSRALASFTENDHRHLAEGGSFSFGSVRRDQAQFYRERGGVCIAIRRPLAPGGTPYSFDQFNPDMVDHWIDNDGDLSDLREKVRQVCNWIKR